MEFVAGKAIVWQQGATLYYQLTSKFILILIDRIFKPKLLAKEPKIGQKQQGSHGINAYMIIELFEHISKCDVIRMDLGNEQEHSYISGSHVRSTTKEGIAQEINERNSICW